METPQVAKLTELLKRYHDILTALKDIANSSKQEMTEKGVCVTWNNENKGDRTQELQAVWNEINNLIK
jgi:hypothetical protein